MNITQSTERYEEWLRQHIPLIKQDLRQKHVEMTADAFAFFRATFYRWVQLWHQHCEELDKAPKVLGVGDLHLENFGTWRDCEGRLVWGVNDFDEATILPYTVDLVRLATSVNLAITGTNHLAASFDQACESVLKGYTKVLETFLSGGRQAICPIVLAEKHGWLLQIAVEQLRDPDQFWRNLGEQPKVNKKDVPPEVIDYVIDLMPSANPELHWKHRQAGLGSLGRPRFVALAMYEGATVAREAKALAPSAWLWERGEDLGMLTLYREILERSVRCPDPMVKQRESWVIRRLAPDCFKIRLEHLPKQYEYDFLTAMGQETGNIHVGTPSSVKAIMRDLEKRPAGWLIAAAEKMTEELKKDWASWCKDGNCIKPVK